MIPEEQSRDEGADRVSKGPATDLPDATMADDTDDDDEYLTEAERAILAAQARKSETDTTATEKDPPKASPPAPPRIRCPAGGLGLPPVPPPQERRRHRRLAGNRSGTVGFARQRRPHPGLPQPRPFPRGGDGPVPRGCDQGPARDRRRQVQPARVFGRCPRRGVGGVLLSGYGSQHRKMAKQIYTENPVFAKYLNRVDEFIDNELG